MHGEWLGAAQGIPSVGTVTFCSQNRGTECITPLLVRWSPNFYTVVANSVFALSPTIHSRESIYINVFFCAVLIWTGYTICSGGLLAGKVASLSDRVEGRFDPNSKMGAMYRARYLNDGYFEALKLLKEVAVSTYPDLGRKFCPMLT